MMNLWLRKYGFTSILFLSGMATVNHGFEKLSRRFDTVAEQLRDVERKVIISGDDISDQCKLANHSLRVLRGKLYPGESRDSTIIRGGIVKDPE
jgi:hypothetical protein